MSEPFVLEVHKVHRRSSGLVQIEGRWLTGSALDAESLVLERTSEPVTCREVEFAEAPLSLLLVCGRMKDAAEAVRVGDKLVQRSPR